MKANSKYSGCMLLITFNSYTLEIQSTSSSDLAIFLRVSLLNTHLRYPRSAALSRIIIHDFDIGIRGATERISVTCKEPSVFQRSQSFGSYHIVERSIVDFDIKNMSIFVLHGLLETKMLPMENRPRLATMIMTGRTGGLADLPCNCLGETQWFRQDLKA